MSVDSEHRPDLSYIQPRERGISSLVNGEHAYESKIGINGDGVIFHGLGADIASFLLDPITGGRVSVPALASVLDRTEQEIREAIKTKVNPKVGVLGLKITETPDKKEYLLQSKRAAVQVFPTEKRAPSVAKSRKRAA